MSLRAAIHAKCRECIYDPKGGSGTWRQQVGACTAYRCPLFPVRPMPEVGVGGDNGVAAEESAESEAA